MKKHRVSLFQLHICWYETKEKETITTTNSSVESGSDIGSIVDDLRIDEEVNNFMEDSSLLQVLD